MKELLNSKSAIERFAGDDELYKTILQTFFETYGQGAYFESPVKTLLTETSKALLDNKQAVYEAHKIKGAAYTVGADRLGDIAFAIEKTAAEKKPDLKNIKTEKTSQMSALQNSFKDTYAKTMEQIKKELSI